MPTKRLLQILILSHVAPFLQYPKKRELDAHCKSHIATLLLDVFNSWMPMHLFSILNGQPGTNKIFNRN